MRTQSTPQQRKSWFVMSRQRLALIMAIVAGFVAFIAVYGATIPIGDVPYIQAQDTPQLDSVTETLIETVIGVSFLVTLVSYQWFVRFPQPSPLHLKVLNAIWRVFERLMMASVVSAIWLAFLVIFIAPIMYVFQGSLAEMSGLPLAVMTAILSAIVGYINAYGTSSMTTVTIIILAVVVLVSGFITAILLTTTTDWWTRAISYLGVGEYGFVFGLTLAVTGILLLIVMLDKLSDLSVIRREGRFVAPRFDVLRVLVVLLCVGFVGIGWFPFTDTTMTLHLIASYLSFGMIMALMFLTGRIVPIYTPMFHRFSLMLFGVCIVAIVFFILGRLTFSVLEFVLLGAGTIWMLGFYTQTRHYIQVTEPELITGVPA